MGSANSRRAIAGAEGLTTQAQIPRDASAWEQIYSETLSTWKYSAVLWGFEPRIDYTNNVKARLQPWCCGGRYFSVRYDSPKEVIERPYFLITITETCFRQDTYIRLPCAYQSRLHVEPDPSGHYLKPVQVVGYREGIAVLQVNANDGKMEFLVVHMKTATVIGMHKIEVTGKHYLCDTLISPDLASFIIKPNAMYVLNFCRGEYQNVIKLVSCKGENGHCPVTKKLFDGIAVRLFVAFDPRYQWRRIAIGNYLRGGRDAVCLYDTDTEVIIVESDTSHYQTTHNIVYSPDGTYLASLILGRSVKDGLFNFPRVLVYSTTDLSILHVIRTTFLAEVPTLSPSALFPLFSETGTHLAIAYGEQGTFYQQVAGVHVYKMPVLLDLQSLCRLTIRDFFDSQDVERLPLPTKLKSYLRFQPSYG
ncbi:hypothetical protein LSH36_1155g00005 [Paralvinella palmiformis]|uniref:SOCS box domain-containing protein n=1 Tax=Paralvinella palmiformis TaxID=53620 RepID=A0AAD9IV50_9ANNE|nr:hypothetical protein LSH36_1155g00005 [Paralvinella palmiformis]